MNRVGFYSWIVIAAVVLEMVHVKTGEIGDQTVTACQQSCRCAGEY
jgi:hypothetical protein